MDITKTVKGFLGYGEEKVAAKEAQMTGQVKSATLLGSILASRKASDTANNPYGSLTSWVFFAIDKIAMRVASTDFELYKYTGTDVTLIEDHEVLAMLDKPNHFQSGIEFKYCIAFNLKLWGSAPIVKVRKENTQTVLGLFCARPDLLKQVNDDKGNIIGYKYRVGNKEETFQAEDIIDVRIPNAYDNRKGASSVLAAHLEIDADISTAVWNKYLIENGAQPAGVLETDRTLTDAAFDRLKTQWENRYGGAANAGRVAILEAGIKYNATSISPKELDYIETRKFNRDTILTLLGVPVGLVISDNVNKANAETAERVFAKETIEPLVKFLTTGLNARLIPDFDESLWLDYANVVPNDAEQMRLDSQASTNVWATVNETRSRYGLPPLEGGDVLYLPFGLTPAMAQARKGMETKGISEFVEMRVDTTKKTLTPKQKQIARNVLARTNKKRALIQRVKEKIEGTMQEKTQEGATLVLRTKDAPKAMGEELPANIKADRMNYLREVANRATQFRKAMQGYFQDQRDEVAGNLVRQLEGKSIETKAIDPENLFNADANKRKLQQILKNHYADNIDDGAGDIAGLLGVAQTTGFMETPAVQQFLLDKPTKLAEYINETTMNLLRSTLAEGVGQGEGLTDLVGRIQSVYDDADGYRAETIARTEVGSAQNFGRAMEMQEQGVEKRMWIAAFVNTRESHAAAHGQTVGVDEPFNVDGETLMYPQDGDGSPENTINCQCSVAPVL